MSNPPDDNLLRAAEDLKRGGWLVSVLGAAGALCRLLLTDEHLTWVWWVRRIAAGGIVAILGYFVIHGRTEPIYEALFYSVCGTAAPELVEMMRKRLLRIVSNEVDTAIKQRRSK
jgi:hypothetical protein